ncbi:hypothetical protein D3C81_1838060 [compost metagenome]
MIYRPDTPLFQNGSDNRLQKVTAFFSISGFTHLDDVGNVFKDPVLFGFLLQMRAHDLIVGCMEALGDLILIQYGG